MALEVGVDIATMQLTYSWGLSPASASVTVPGVLSVNVGDAATMTLGGATFNGIISQNPVITSQGKTTELQLVDNRIKLMWDDVYGSFNNSEVRADNPLTPGIDRQKRFWHILPDDFEAYKKTWTDDPYTASEIFDFILHAPTVDNEWALVLHLDQSKPVYAIDATNGSKVGTLFQEMSDQQGLVFTLQGENTLVWVRKGEGDLDDPPDNSTDLKDGDALSNNDTNILVLGDRNRYQDLPIFLEADWLAAYQEFWAEPAWLQEVATVFDIDGESLAGQADLMAKARSVTIGEYAQEKGDADTYLDYGTWGECGRMDIPVWTYLQDIVWKAYRVPLDYTVNGIEREFLEMLDGLQAQVTYDITSGVMSYKSPRELYPDAKAFIIAQGQPVDLLDPRTHGTITPAQLAAAQTNWSAQNKFNLDVKNYCVIFEHAVFKTGTGDHALFLFPNHDVAGISEGDPLYNLAVPNAKVTVEPAPVRASLVFAAERYSHRFGSGNRKGTKYVPALNYHALMEGGVFTEELPYADGDNVFDKAQEYGDVISAQLSVYRSGGYTRHGTVGTALTSTIDRVTISLSFDEGITERVEYTKERAPATYQHERELDRIPKSRDLYPGQRANVKDVERLRIIANLSREIKRTSPTHYDSVAEVLQKPVGSANSSVVLRTVGTPAIPGHDGGDDTPAVDALAGEVVWKDGESDSDHKSFAGIVIADGSSNNAACAISGTVPVRVKGTFHAGDTVGASEGEKQALVDSSGSNWHPLGTVLGNYEGDEVMLVPVQLGGGGAGAGSCPFDLTIKVDPDDDTARIGKVRPGLLNGLLPTNAFDDFPFSGTGTYYLKTHCTSDAFQITEVALALDGTVNTAFATQLDAPPSDAEVLIYVIVDGVPFKVIACGDISLTPKLVGITEKSPPVAGESLFIKTWAWGINNSVDGGEGA